MSHSSLTTQDPIINVMVGAAQPLVLVVDDHPDTRDLLRFVIEARGWRVVEAADGEEAVRLAESTRPNLILMDASLPCVDGYIATERIRKLESDHQITVIFLSGHAQPEARQKAFAAGGVEFLVKPIMLDELEVALEKYLTIADSYTC